MTIKRIQFRPGGLAEEFLRRTDLAMSGSAEAAAARVAQRDLERYYALLDDALRAIARDLTPEEARQVVLAHRSHALTLHTPLALPDHARAWSLTRRLALIDALERLRCLAAPDSDLDALIAAVGLTRPPS